MFNLFDILAKLGGILAIVGTAIGIIFREYIKARLTDHFARSIATGKNIVGAVTPQRLKWGEEIQELIGSFCGTAHYLRFSLDKGSDEASKKIEEIDRLRHHIPLHLCERTQRELEIEECVKAIASMTSGRLVVSDEEFRDTLDKLIRQTQDLLHDNWTSITSEAQKGAVVDRPRTV